MNERSKNISESLFLFFFFIVFILLLLVVKLVSAVSVNVEVFTAAGCAPANKDASDSGVYDGCQNIWRVNAWKTAFSTAQPVKVEFISCTPGGNARYTAYLNSCSGGGVDDDTIT